MPSGNVSCCSTISERLRGTVNSTPSKPPRPAITQTHQYSNSCQYPRMISAGKVKITPAASDSPAEAEVWTMLFSRMFDSRNSRSMAIEITAAGIEADTVIPANSPR